MSRILCLTSHSLDGPDYGANLRVRNICRLLERFGEVRVVLAAPHVESPEINKTTTGAFALAGVIQFHSTSRPPIGQRLQREFDGRFTNSEWSQASEEDHLKLQRLIACHDLVWIHGVRVANGFNFRHWSRSVLDIDDLPSSYLRTELAQTSGVVARLRCRRQFWLWRRRERFLGERFSALCVCSEQDRRELERSKNVFVVPNGFTAPPTPFTRQPANPPRIGFVGTFKYKPNREGVRWFAEKVWPQILAARPDARLRLVGDGSESGEWATKRNVNGLGWIGDLPAEMDTWSLAIVPVFVGGGTRLKIAEAMGSKCPLVSTSLGAYGYQVEHGREILIADSPAEFAAKCLFLLANPEEAKRLAMNALNKFQANFTWEATGDSISQVVAAVMDPHTCCPVGELATAH